MLAKPVCDDVGQVRILRAFPRAKVNDVVMDLVDQIKPNDLYPEIQCVPLLCGRGPQLA